MALVLSGGTRKLVTDLDNETVKDIESKKEIILTIPVSPMIMNLPNNLNKSTPDNQRSNHSRLSGSGGAVCRICHEDETAEELISPCDCIGSLGLVHATCLEKWLSSSNTTRCEICKYQYTVSREPKSLRQWLKSSNCRYGPTGFYGDVFCLILLTPLCVGSVYLCAVGARVYIKHGLWEGTGLAVLCCFLMAVYILWCFVTIRFHWRRLKSWQASNQTVHLIVKEYYRKDDRIKVMSNNNKNITNNNSNITSVRHSDIEMANIVT